MIRAKNIRLSFNNNGYVFNNFSFDILTNEHVCFAGASGKGKSSVLKLLQGYVLPEQGQIHINGLELNAENIREIRGMTAYIPQNINLPVETGEELIKMLGLEKNHELIENLLTELALERDFLYRNFDEISGGQKQRIVIAVCLSLDRSIILLDEPTASLDADATQKLKALIKKFNNKTIVSASHNPEWMEAASKVIYL